MQPRAAKSAIYGRGLAIHSNARGVGAGKPKSKSADDARPLGCTNAYARLVARCLLAGITDALNDYFLNSSDKCKQFAFCRGETEMNAGQVRRRGTRVARVCWLP